VEITKIINSLKNEEFAVFCGAGISYNSGLPLANELKRYILKQLPINDEDIDEIMNSTLPFEAFMETLTEHAEISKILDLFKEGEANTNHILMAKLAKVGILKTICTTNFDLLIEKAMENEGLKKGKDFEVYCNEEQFSGVDFNDLNKINIFKIHGSADDEKSIRTTLKEVASKTLSEKRMDVIRHLFSDGNHEKVLVLGYSCSDVFDITTQIQSIEKSQKEIIFVDHCTDGIDGTDIRKVDKLLNGNDNPFKKFQGERIICDTDKFIEELWNYFKEITSEYTFIKSNAEWKRNIYGWIDELKEYESIKYFLAGSIFINIPNFKKAIKYFKKSLEISEKNGYKKGESLCYMNIGIAYTNIGKFDKAIEYAEKSLEIAEKNEDKEGESARYEKLYNKSRFGSHISYKCIKSKCYGNIGNVYNYKKEFDKAIYYYKKSLEIAKELGYEQGELASHDNIGNAYNKLGCSDIAIEYHKDSLKIAKKIGDMHGKSTAYINLGAAYGDLWCSNKAIQYYKKSLEINERLGNLVGKAACYKDMGAHHYKLGEFKTAVEYYLDAKKIFKDTEQIQQLKELYGYLSLAYGKIGDNTNAEKYKKKSNEINQNLNKI